MPRKFFLPPIGSIWRFTADWTTPPERFLNRSDHDETLWGFPGRHGSIEAWQKATGENTNGDAHGPGGWVERYRAWLQKHKAERGLTFPKGTVIQIDRYHVSRSGEDQITVTVKASPQMLLHPKKLKGQMRGAGRLYFTLSEFNRLPEMENVNDLFQDR